LVLGRRPLGAILHSSNEPGELSQWLCHDDSTINIVVLIIIIMDWICSETDSPRLDLHVTPSIFMLKTLWERRAVQRRTKFTDCCNNGVVFIQKWPATASLCVVYSMRSTCEGRWRWQSRWWMVISRMFSFSTRTLSLIIKFLSLFVVTYL